MSDSSQDFKSGNQSLIPFHSAPELLVPQDFSQLWKQALEQFADRPALEFAGQVVSYQVLDQVQKTIGRSLLGRGVRSGDRVIVHLSRSIQLQATILALLNLGITYVPVDADIPLDRVRTIQDECGARFAIFDAGTEEKLSVEPARDTDLRISELAQVNKDTDVSTSVKVSPSSEAYIIFTSGSTGKPKGIAVSQRSLCHLIRSENLILKINSQDRVWQGFSVGFDMWIEESLITLTAGGTLVVGAPMDVRAVDQLSQKLRDSKVTVLHIVPTLAGAISEDIPTLRIVNFGGEACPKPLAQRWWKPGRIIYNSYGPTETTVTATLTEVIPGEEITIGRPLPNYTAYVVNDRNEPLGLGERGELLIGGPGVSLGYVNRSDLNPQKFIENPWSPANELDPVLYRSGDLVSLNQQGNIEFHGRIDSQIKIRGYRVELEEIEAALSEQPGVQTAAVKIEKDEAGIDHIVAFVKASELGLEKESLRRALQKRLPSYMLPSEIVTLETMPVLTSGKVDRKSLPQGLCKKFEVSGTCLMDESLYRTTTQRRVAVAMSQVFGGHSPAVNEDFFYDLGGHSLLAAAFVSDLRRQPQFESLSIMDVYKYRTLEKISFHLDSLSTWAEETEHETQSLQAAEASEFQKIVFASAQLFCLILIYGISALQFFAPFLGYFLSGSATFAVGAGLVVAVGHLILVVAAKWLLLGRVKEGDYSLTSLFYLKWWFVRRLKEKSMLPLFGGTPLAPFLMRALGARIGHSTSLGQIQVDAEDLLEVGDGASLSSYAMIDNAVIEKGWLRLQKIQIGKNAYVGTAAVIGRGSHLEDWSEVGDLAALPPDSVVPRAEVWGGSPAEFQKKVDVRSRTRSSDPSPFAKVLISGIYLVACLVLTLLPTIPLLAVFAYLRSFLPEGAHSWGLVALHAPVLALLFLGGFALLAWVLRWLVLGRMKEGRYSLHSFSYFRKWFVDQVSEASLVVLQPLYATLFLPLWLRALGVKVGARAEVSTVTPLTYHLVELGPESFVADRVIMGDPMIKDGWIELQRTSIGRRSFLGNSAFLEDGQHWPDEALLGVLSLSPENMKSVTKNSTWLGIPAQELPGREVIEGVNPCLTYQPSLSKYIQRTLVESFRVLFPQTLLFFTAILSIRFWTELTLGWSLWAALALLPIVYMVGVALPAFFSMVVFKWLAVGVYKSARWPMWTRQVWWSEAVTSTYEALAVPMVLDSLKGTPFLAMGLRLLGMKIGRGVVLETTDFTEFDLVTLGDGVVLETNCGAQTHLFEDRVMKLGPVTIEDRVQVGAQSVILYDTLIESDVQLATNSLVMKGERLPASTKWQGSPARAQRLVKQVRDDVQRRNTDALEAVSVK